MKTWKLTLEYDGTRYAGWQDQKNARTVMGELRRAAEVWFGTKVEMMGAGRTDAGVHAAAQVAHLRAEVPWRVDPARMVRELNERLPPDIAVLDVEPAPASFHARHDAIRRTYVYQISSRKSAFSKKYIWWIKESLDLNLMRRAAVALLGRHDFVCFRAEDPSKPAESTEVEIHAAALEERKDDGLVLIRIEASHFLWRMVRRIVGVVVKLGRHEIAWEDFEQLLGGKPSDKLNVAAWTAPACGLFLEAVTYPEPKRAARGTDRRTGGRVRRRNAPPTETRAGLPSRKSGPLATWDVRSSRW